jgi:hypothetical protein
MPLVFVHGVNTRRGQTQAEQEVFDNRVTLIGEHFRNVVFADRVTARDGLKVFAPYWGDLGVKFIRNLACLPKSDLQELAIAQPETAPLVEATLANLDAGLLEDANLRIAPLVTVAHARSLGSAVDLLIAGAANAPLPGLIAGTLKQALPDAARFASAAEQYAAAHPQPAWLGTVPDDQAFLHQLLKEVAAYMKSHVTATPPGTRVESLSIGDTLSSWLENGISAVQGAVTTVVDTAKGAVTGAAIGAARDAFLRLSASARPAASAVVGRFFGDVFTYMENRQPILDRVLADVRLAIAAKRPGDDELYLVGHSFGGIILYDILTYVRREEALVCDLYVTVGSQVALFAEIGRLADRENIDAAFNSGPNAVVARPSAVQRWLNIFDPTDLFGFGTRGVFGGAKDYPFQTDALPIISHGAYFDTPRFFGRLKNRVEEAFATGTGGPLS